MKRRSRKCSCPCKKGAPKSACGLKGLRRGIACPCPPKGVRGLRGTVAEHETQTGRFIAHSKSQGRYAATAGGGKACRASVLRLEYAAAAAAEAGWVGGTTQIAARKELSAARAQVARKCPDVLRGAPKL